jgi:lysozyme
MESQPINFKPSQNCYDLIKQWEGLFLKAYDDGGGVWTIGWGTIIYPNGEKVKQGDVCTMEQAENYLHWEVFNKTHGINAMVFFKPLTQNQFDAMVCFAYNCGLGALQGSTLYKKAKINPWDYSIYEYQKDRNGKPMVKSCEFLKWVYDNGKLIQGLVNRRVAEADLYGKTV